MKKILKNIFIILTRSEKKKLWLLSLADVCISLLDIIFLLVLLYIIQFYTQSAPVLSVNGFSLRASNAHPLLLITVFFILFAIKNTAGFLVARQQYQFVYKVAARLSRSIITQYLDGSYHDFVNIDSSVVNRRISQAPIEFAHYVLNGLQQLASQAVLVFITFVVVFVFNPLLFPLLLLLIIPPVLLIGFLMKRQLAAGIARGKQTSEQSIQHLQEALAAFVEGNLYQKKDFFINRYHSLQVQLNQYISGRLAIQNMPPRLIEVFAIFGLLVLVLANYLHGKGPAVPLLTIGALMVAAYKMIPGIVKIANLAGQVKTYAFTAADLVTSVTTETIQPPGTHAPITSIAFEKISFDFPDKKILHALSFCLQQGDFVTVTGGSGKGKTTLINLLLGFLTPASGTICINGQLADTTLRQSYRPRIAYAKQQLFLLHASIIENISLQENDYDKALIEKLAVLAGLDKLVEALPMGLQSIISENGKNISGGQRQRIIFARALYKNADLVILDEPFNELDTAAEISLLTVLQQMAAEGKMVLLITHNTGAIPFGNKHLQLEDQH